VKCGELTGIVKRLRFQERFMNFILGSILPTYRRGFFAPTGREALFGEQIGQNLKSVWQKFRQFKLEI
jgi:hypothetical protein